MSLLDEFHKVLTGFREHVAGLVNSGMVTTIDGHLDRLAAAAEGEVQAADEALKSVLTELYTALHGAQPVEESPASVPVLVGEPGPELPLATGGTVIAGSEWSPAAEEPQAPEADLSVAG